MYRHLDKYTIFKSTYQFFSKEEFNRLYPDIKDTRFKLDVNVLPVIKK
jgi:hypothetical protein